MQLSAHVGPEHLSVFATIIVTAHHRPTSVVTLASYKTSQKEERVYEASASGELFWKLPISAPL